MAQSTQHLYEFGVFVSILTKRDLLRDGEVVQVLGKDQVYPGQSDQIFAYAWSGDGKRLACARGNQISDVVLMSGIR